MRSAFTVPTPRSSALRAINYAPEIEVLARPRRGHFKSEPLASLLVDFGRSYWSVFARRDCAPTHGVELLSQVDMFATEPSGRTIRLDSMPRPDDHEIKRWQILVAGTGQMGEGNLFGRSIIADRRLTGRYLGQHAIALGFEDAGSDTNLWTYAFLNTALGLRALRSCAFGTSIPGLRLDLVAALRIPIPENEQTLARVGSLIRTCVDQREKFATQLKSARSLIEGLPELRSANAMCADRKATYIVWNDKLPTLAARTYAAAGPVLQEMRKSCPVRLRDVLQENGMYFGSLRQRTPCDSGHGVPMLSQRDILSVRPLPRWIAMPRMDRAALFSPAHSIVVSGEGGVGEGHSVATPVYVSPYLSRYALNEHLLRIVPKPEHAALCHMFLATAVGKKLIQSTASGTVIQKLRTDLLLDLPFPNLDGESLRALRQHHTSAVEALDQSFEAESEAIRIIEEEVLPAWLA